MCAQFPEVLQLSCVEFHIRSVPYHDRPQSMRHLVEHHSLMQDSISSVSFSLILLQCWELDHGRKWFRKYMEV